MNESSTREDRIARLQMLQQAAGRRAVQQQVVAHARVQRRDDKGLAFLREAMGAAARDMEPFDEAYARIDWSRFEHLPLFRAANRMNAYNTYLLMEQQQR